MKYLRDVRNVELKLEGRTPEDTITRTIAVAGEAFDPKALHETARMLADMVLGELQGEQ